MMMMDKDSADPQLRSLGKFDFDELSQNLQLSI